PKRHSSFFLKLDNNLDSIDIVWYQYDTLSTYLWSLTPVPWGGFMATGFVFNPPNNNVNHYSMLMVKFDDSLQVEWEILRDEGNMSSYLYRPIFTPDSCYIFSY
ncbi:hypothetical protein RZS08_67320, partial [Arthrospira platensis SPKY1]|nr:hypothetical protein [Arthrospira platensis SPKY1]